MKTFDITLDQLLQEINQSINTKIIGINFLELLKSSLIEKFRNLEQNDLKNLKLMPPNGQTLEREIDLNNRKLKYKIMYFDKSVSNIKQKIENDYLFMIIIIQQSRYIVTYQKIWVLF